MKRNRLDVIDNNQIEEDNKNVQFTEHEKKVARAIERLENSTGGWVSLDLENLKTLQSGDLNKCFYDAQRRMKKYGPEQCEISEINLNDTGFAEESVENPVRKSEPLREYIKQNNFRLKYVSLNYNKLGNSIMLRLLVASLMQSESISKLSLVGNRLSDNDCNFLSHLLRTDAPTSCIKLEELNLWNNKIGWKGGRILSQSLASNSVLNCLNLTRNCLEDKGIVAVCDALRTNTTLTNLSLYNNNISDRACLAVSELFLLNPRLPLASFSLGCDNPLRSFSSPGFLSLMKAFNFFPSLTSLSISTCDPLHPSLIERLLSRNQHNLLMRQRSLAVRAWILCVDRGIPLRQLLSPLFISMYHPIYPLRDSLKHPHSSRTCSLCKDPTHDRRKCPFLLKPSSSR